MGYELIIDGDMENSYEFSTIKGMDDLDNLFFGNASYSHKYPALKKLLLVGYCENLISLESNINGFMAEISNEDALGILKNLLNNIKNAKKDVSVVM